MVVKWKMVEKLAGAVPCSDRRHTGEYIGELSNAAWAASGIVKPTEEIFGKRDQLPSVERYGAVDRSSFYCYYST